MGQNNGVTAQLNYYVTLHLDVCTVHFVNFYYICPKMHNVCYKHLFLITILHVSMCTRHTQGASYDVC
jgi:hypothetical protein